jgi:cell division GTPase FtsZ
MKMVVVGVGQCGGRIADAFSRQNRRAKHERNLEIFTDCFAVNTDAADLAGLETIKAEASHRILIGARVTFGHGVAKVSETGAEIAKADADKVIESFRKSQRFFEADAFLVVGGAAGGTGSGATPILAQVLRERFEKPVYALIVLPFEHEERTEERSVLNTAVCLKSISGIADAVILVQNQRYIKKDSSLKSNISRINDLIVEPFYNLLSAGEEKKPKHIGTRVLDTGDIKMTLVGWSAIGYGEIPLSRFGIPFVGSDGPKFMTKSLDTQKGIQAMEFAVSELSVKTKTSDAGRALYLVTAPSHEMNVELIKELGDYVRSIASSATIRHGDYPRGKNKMEITLILSELGDVAIVRDYYARSLQLSKEIIERQKVKDKKHSLDDDASKDVPTLI